MAFRKGVSGNPGGRPRIPPDLKKSCRRLAMVGMKALEDIIRNKASKPSDIIAATKLMMEYGYGKPVQPVGGEDEGGGVVVNVLTLAQSGWDAPEEGG